jgi:transposase
VCAAGSCSRSLGCRSRGKGRSRPSLRLIDELDREIGECERELRRLGADHHYVPPLLLTVPGIGWVLAYTIAAEIGDIGRFASPRKLVGYSGLCPRVYQSGERDLRAALKAGSRYLRWALVEAATHACTHPVYRDRYQQTKARIGKQRGAKVAQTTSPADSPKRSGTCSAASNPSLPKAPPTPWPPDGP